MPRLNFWILLTAVLLYFLCSGTTLRDRLLIHSLHRIEENALVEPSPKLLFEGAMGGMVHKLYDPLEDDYSAFIPNVDRKEYEEGLDNRFDGIGIIYDKSSKDEEPEIIYPVLHSPAYHAGLRSGDRIRSVDGHATRHLSRNEVFELFKGEIDREVVLSVVPFGKTEAVEFRVRRAPIQRESVEGDGVDPEGKRRFRLSTDPEIGYVRITAFSAQTALELRDVLAELEQSDAGQPDIQGLILDLRNNPGGYVDVCVRIAEMFVQPVDGMDVIVSTRARDGQIKSVHRARKNDRVFTLPMTVLIDEKSASAAEILSACLQDYGRATIVGTRSFGKGVVQEIFHLPFNSGTLQLTDASYWRPSGQNIHRSRNATESDAWGVTPDEEGLLPVSVWQHFAQLQIRERCSNLVSDDESAYWKNYLDRLKKEIDEKIKIRGDLKKLEEKLDVEEVFVAETTEDEEPAEIESTEPFTLKGNAPYYDPQLDRAVELLKRSTNDTEKHEK